MEGSRSAEDYALVYAADRTVYCMRSRTGELTLAAHPGHRLI